ncbi:hypothetical protein [Campylobacter phage CJLB-14]|nr:hypothetical protein [Campylobacter phage CJLB-14]
MIQFRTIFYANSSTISKSILSILILYMSVK